MLVRSVSAYVTQGLQIWAGALEGQYLVLAPQEDQWSLQG